ncbi:MAG: hypothetical protein A2Z14_14755 [Chloroflexi bacterium RBG_16_48_8]|nr:MAG: hypothetical protein A2Z14_14755 [Chloroflexi bacterium RBG_16_48_8]
MRMDMILEEIIAKLSVAIVNGDEEAAGKFSAEALDMGADPRKLIQEAIQSALDTVGNNFENGKAYLPELIMAGDAAHAALKFIIPKIQDREAKAINKGTVVLGTPFGDNHDIGKNIVGAILTARGFRVIDIGINVPPNKYIEAAVKENADIIAVSTLITTSLPYQREIIKILQDRGLRDKYFVILGGGPVTPGWTREINADGYGWSAIDAATLCLQLMDGNKKPPLPEPLIFGELRR